MVINYKQTEDSKLNDKMKLHCEFIAKAFRENGTYCECNGNPPELLISIANDKFDITIIESCPDCTILINDFLKRNNFR
jgi:hypothetical protein